MKQMISQNCDVGDPSDNSCNIN